MADLLDLLRSPLALVLVTLLTYRAGIWLRTVSGAHPLAQPALVAIIGTAAWLVALGVDHADYAEAATVISFWLAPATVALAIPLHRQFSRLKGVVLPLLLGIPLGAAASILIGYGAVHLFGGDEQLALTMAPKAATSPVAIVLSEQVGGIAPLTAVLAICVGILGAVAGPTVLTLARVRDRRARGIAMGNVSHGIGTSRSLLDDETEGAFAGLSMALSALATSLLLPVVLWLL